MGRPSIYSQETADRICERLANGESARSVCRDPDMPSQPTLWRWMREHDGFCKQYEKATEDRAMSMFEEMIEIADDSSNDVVIGEDGKERCNTEFVNRSRLRVDTRKWCLARMHPKKYSEKIVQEITGPEGGPLAFVIRDMTKNA